MLVGHGQKIAMFVGFRMRFAVNRQQIKKGGGEYVLAVKDNQDVTARELQEYFAAAEEESDKWQIQHEETKDKGHGHQMFLVGDDRSGQAFDNLVTNVLIGISPISQSTKCIYTQLRQLIESGRGHVVFSM